MRPLLHLLAYFFALTGLAFFTLAIAGGSKALWVGLGTFELILCGCAFVFLAGQAVAILIALRALDVLNAEWITRDAPSEVDEIKDIRRRNRDSR